MSSAPSTAALMPIRLNVNARTSTVQALPSSTLLHVLRNQLSLNGPKYGCGLGQCGACTVHVDGVAARACVIPARHVQDRQITTLEGLGRADRPHPVQQAFVKAQAAQCGYCLNGMIMTTAALLAQEPKPECRSVFETPCLAICADAARILKFLRPWCRRRKPCLRHEPFRTIDPVAHAARFSCRQRRAADHA